MSKRGNHLTNPDPTTKASSLKNSTPQELNISEVQRDACGIILMSDQLFLKLKHKLNRMKDMFQSFLIFSHGDKYIHSELLCSEVFHNDALSYQEGCLAFTNHMFFNCNRDVQVHMYKAVSFMGLVIQCLTDLDRISNSHHNILAHVMLLAISEGRRQSSDTTKRWEICCLILLPKDCFSFRFRLPEYRQLCLSRLRIVPPNKEHLVYYMTEYKMHE
jgi:hypothetical protein